MYKSEILIIFLRDCGKEDKERRDRGRETWTRGMMEDLTKEGDMGKEDRERGKEKERARGKR